MTGVDEILPGEAKQDVKKLWVPPKERAREFVVEFGGNGPRETISCHHVTFGEHVVFLRLTDRGEFIVAAYNAELVVSVVEVEVPDPTE